MFNVKSLATVIALSVIPAVLLAADPINVKLTVQERLGVARVNEPITSGVPMPKGAVKDVAELTLWDAADTPVPAQFTVANRWWDDNSVKWVHVDFAASVPAKGAATFFVKQAAGPAAKAVSPLKAVATDAGVEVNTGPLKFTVSAKGTGLFDAVELNGKPIVTESKIALNTPRGLFVPSADGGRKVTIEEQGPMKVVVLLAGHNVPAAATRPEDAYGMDYKIRVYAYANSPLVKVAYTLENRRGKLVDHIDLSDWSITMGVGGAGPKRCLLGLADRPVTTEPAQADESARVEVVATDSYKLSGKADGQGDPLKENPAWLGAADLTSVNGGVTVMVRNFWQLWAKYLQADGHGNLTVGLWTNNIRDKGKATFTDADGNIQFYAGVARTHEIYFSFHGPAIPALDVAPLRAVAAAREPLFARCEPAWYCQGSQAFGDLSEADPNVYQDAFKSDIERLNLWAEASVKRPLKRWQTERAGQDNAVTSFGILSYGDGIEEHNDGQRWDRVHWEGGYYDYMHAIYLNFVRTGDPFYLWTATDMSQHNAEVHHTHHDGLGGRSRYCPSWGHIIMDDEKKPYASGTFNHWKNTSTFERWYLLGDYRAREAAMETMGFAMRLGNDGIDFGQPRSICHALHGFWAGYDATGDRKYLDAMARFAKKTAAKIDKGEKMGSGSWQRGMALQGLALYIEKTGDNSVQPAIVKALERDWNGLSANMGYALAFMWKKTGEPRYFVKAVGFLGGSRKGDQWMQRFGEAARSKFYVPVIVRKDAARPAPPPTTATQPGA